MGQGCPGKLALEIDLIKKMPDKRDREKMNSSMEIEIQFINVRKDKQIVIHKERKMGLRGQPSSQKLPFCVVRVCLRAGLQTPAQAYRYWTGSH